VRRLCGSSQLSCIVIEGFARFSVRQVTVTGISSAGLGGIHIGERSIVRFGSRESSRSVFAPFSTLRDTRTSTQSERGSVRESSCCETSWAGTSARLPAVAERTQRRSARSPPDRIRSRPAHLGSTAISAMRRHPWAVSSHNFGRRRGGATRSSIAGRSQFFLL